MTEIKARTWDCDFYTDAKSYLSNGSMQAEYDYLMNAVTEDDLFVDVGAHIGMIFCSVVKARRPFLAVAFEPTPRSFELLSKNAKENLTTNYLLENMAVSNTSETRDMFECGFGSPSNSLLDRWEGKANKIEIKTTTLDEALHDHQILGRGKYVIKIDAELSEPDVWAGMYRTRKNAKAITMEIFNRAFKDIGEGDKVRKLLKSIRTDGFTISDLGGRDLSDQEILQSEQIDIAITPKRQ